MPQDSIALTSQAEIDWIRAKVRDGEFESEQEALTVGVLRLREEEQERESWWHQVGQAAYDNFMANPKAVYTVEEVRDNLSARRKQRAEQGVSRSLSSSANAQEQIWMTSRST